MTMRRGIFGILGLVSILWIKTASAHAIVVASAPQAGSSVSGPDISIEIRFNSRVDAERSRLTLVRPDGASALLTLDGGGASEQLHAGAKGLEPGPYRLLWQTLSIDGHITHGEIPFVVVR